MASSRVSARGHINGQEAIFSFMANHHSQSGPVRVIRRFTPVPATPAEEEARLMQKLAIIEDRIADRATFVAGIYGGGAVYRKTSRQLRNLLRQRDETAATLSELRGEAEDAT